jgi:hypothetical protein
MQQSDPASTENITSTDDISTTIALEESPDPSLSAMAQGTSEFPNDFISIVLDESHDGQAPPTEATGPTDMDGVISHNVSHHDPYPTPEAQVLNSAPGYVESLHQTTSVEDDRSPHEGKLNTVPPRVLLPVPEFTATSSQPGVIQTIYTSARAALFPSTPQSSSSSAVPTTSYAELYKDYAELYKAYEGEKRRGDRYKARFQILQEDIGAEREASGKKIAELEAQIKEFRTQVFEMGSGHGPIKTEEYYSSNFEALGCLIEKEIVKLSKVHRNYTLTDLQTSQVLSYISEVGTLGQKCSDLLKSEGTYSLQNLYSQGKLRILLIRHVIALFLYERIFDPFAFGVSREVSDCLRSVDRDIMFRGTLARNTALIGQTVSSPTYCSYTKRMVGALGCMPRHRLNCVSKRLS